MKIQNFHLRGLRGQMVVGFGVKGLGAATSFLFTWLLARTVGPAGVGIFGSAQATVQMCVMLALLGLDSILVRSVAVSLSQESSGHARAAAIHAIRMGTGAGLLLTALILLFHRPIADYLIGDAAITSLMVLSLIIPIMVYCRLLSTVLRGVRWIARSQLIDGPVNTMFGSAVLTAFLLMGAPVTAVFASELFLTGWLITAVISTLMYRRAIRDWGPREPLRDTMLRHGFLIVVANVNNIFTDWFATILLVSTHGPVEAGLFRVGYQIAATMRLLSATTETILQPVFAVSYQQGDLVRIGRLLRRAIAFLILASSPIAVAVLVVPEFIMHMFGKQFVGGAMAMQILVLGQAFSLVFGSSGSVLVMAGRERLNVTLTTIGAVIGVVLSLLLIPPYGAVGAALALAGPLLFLRLATITAVWRLGVPLI